MHQVIFDFIYSYGSYIYTALWWLVMVLMVRRGFLDKVNSYPVGSLIWACSWNLEYAFNRDSSLFTRDWVMIPGFLVLDALLFLLMVRNPGKDIKIFYSNSKQFALVFLVSLSMMTLFQHGLFTYVSGAAGSGKNLYVSIYWHSQLLILFFYSLAFVTMLKLRNSTQGQSIYFPLLRIVANCFALASILVQYSQVLYAGWLFGFFVVSISAFDVIYFVLLKKKFEAEGLSPWRCL